MIASGFVRANHAHGHAAAGLRVARARWQHALGTPAPAAGDARRHGLPPASAWLLQAVPATGTAQKIPVKVTLPAANNPKIDVLVNETFAAMEKGWQGLDVEAWPEVPQAPLAWIGGVLF